MISKALISSLTLIRYSSILCNRFSKTYPTDRDLRIALGGIPWSKGGALDKALQMTNDLYEKEARPNAKKILVVIMDKKVITGI